MRRMFSKNQLRDIIENSDIDFKGDIKINGESVFQTFDGVITLPEGLTIVSSYCKTVRNFNELQFIFNIRINNSTEAGINIANDTQVCHFDLPSELKEKIYAHNGNNLNHGSTEGSVAICSLFVSTPSGLYSQNPRYINLYHTSGVLAMYHLAPSGDSTTIPSEATIDLEARISLAL